MGRTRRGPLGGGAGRGTAGRRKQKLPRETQKQTKTAEIRRISAVFVHPKKLAPRAAEGP